MAEYDFDGEIGVLPNGDTETFETEADYEDAYIDMMFDMQNSFAVEFPEDY